MAGSKRAITSLSALFIGVSFIFIASGLVVSSAGVLLDELGASKAQIGLITSCFFIGALACTIVSHRLISHVGHMRAYAIFTALFAISALLHDISNNLIFWAILRFMLGFCYYSIVLIVESWLNEKIPNSVRSRVLGFYEIIFYGAFAIGAVIMSMDLSTAKVFLVGTIAIILGSIPLNFLKIKSPKIPKAMSISLPKIYNIAPLALATSIIAGLTMNGFFSMASLFIITQGYTPAQAGIFIIIGMCGGFIAHTIFGTISDKFGRKLAIILASSVALLACFIFVFISPGITFQYVIVFFLGFGIFVLYALALARANDVVTDKNAYVEVVRTLLFSYLIGSFLSTIVIGFLINQFGAMAFIYYYITLLAFLIIFATFQKNVPKDQEVAFARHGGHSVIFDELNNDNSK